MQVLQLKLIFFLVTTISKCEFSPTTELKRSKRIVNGYRCTTDSHPFFAALTVDPIERKYTFLCASVIISRKWTLTTRHCCLIYPPYKMKIVVDLYQLTDVETAPSYPISNIYHAWRQSSRTEHALCLVRLRVPIKFNNNVNKIDLVPKNVKLESCKTALIMGFGHVNTMDLKGRFVKKINEYDMHLQCTDINPLYNEDCVARYSKFEWKKKFCSYNQARGACYGDEGGPVIYGDKLIGIIYRLHGCNYNHSTSMTTILRLDSIVRDYIDEILSFYGCANKIILKYWCNLGSVLLLINMLF